MSPSLIIFVSIVSIFYSNSSEKCLLILEKKPVELEGLVLKTIFTAIPLVEFCFESRGTLHPGK